MSSVLINPSRTSETSKESRHWFGNVIKVPSLPEAHAIFCDGVVFNKEDNKFYRCVKMDLPDGGGFYFEWQAVTSAAKRSFLIPVGKLTQYDAAHEKWDDWTEKDTLHTVATTINEIIFGLLRYKVNIEPFGYTKVEGLSDDQVIPANTYFYWQWLDQVVWNTSYKPEFTRHKKFTGVFQKVEPNKHGDTFAKVKKNLGIDCVYTQDDIYDPDQFNVNAAIKAAIVPKLNALIRELNKHGTELNLGVSTEDSYADLAKTINDIVDEVNPYSSHWQILINRIWQVEDILGRGIFTEPSTADEAVTQKIDIATWQGVEWLHNYFRTRDTSPVKGKTYYTYNEQGQMSPAVISGGKFPSSTHDYYEKFTSSDLKFTNTVSTIESILKLLNSIDTTVGSLDGGDTPLATYIANLKQRVKNNEYHLGNVDKSITEINVTIGDINDRLRANRELILGEVNVRKTAVEGLATDISNVSSRVDDAVSGINEIQATFGDIRYVVPTEANFQPNTTYYKWDSAKGMYVPIEVTDGNSIAEYINTNHVKVLKLDNSETVRSLIDGLKNQLTDVDEKNTNAIEAVKNTVDPLVPKVEDLATDVDKLTKNADDLRKITVGDSTESAVTGADRQGYMSMGDNDFLNYAGIQAYMLAKADGTADGIYRLVTDLFGVSTVRQWKEKYLQTPLGKGQTITGFYQRNVKYASKDTHRGLIDLNTRAIGHLAGNYYIQNDTIKDLREDVDNLQESTKRLTEIDKLKRIVIGNKNYDDTTIGRDPDQDWTVPARDHETRLDEQRQLIANLQKQVDQMVINSIQPSLAMMTALTQERFTVSELHYLVDRIITVQNAFNKLVGTDVPWQKATGVFQTGYTYYRKGDGDTYTKLHDATDYVVGLEIGSDIYTKELVGPVTENYSIKDIKIAINRMVAYYKSMSVIYPEYSELPSDTVINRGVTYYRNVDGVYDEILPERDDPSMIGKTVREYDPNNRWYLKITEQIPEDEYTCTPLRIYANEFLKLLRITVDNKISEMYTNK